MDIGDYTAKYAAQYSGAGWFERVLVEARRQRVLASLARHPHARILEVGCGLEPLFEHWKDYEQFTVVEPSPEFVAHARSVSRDRPGIEVFQGFLEDLGNEIAPRRPFDFVVVSSLLHEVPDPERLLATIRALCSANTVVHFNVPNVYSFHRLLALEMGLIESLFEPSATEKKFQRHTRFDKARLLATLEGAGFDVLESGTYFIKPFTHAQMEALIDKGVLDRSVLVGLERMVKYLPDMGAEMFADVRLPGGRSAS